MSSASPPATQPSDAAGRTEPTRAPRTGRGRGLLRFLLVRLGTGIVLAIGITLVAFLLTQKVPGDAAAANLGQRAIDDPAAVEAFNARYGLDKPLVVQYATYLGNLVQGDLGESQRTRVPVATELAEYVPATMELALFAIVVSLVIGVALGLVGAVYRDRWPDQLVRVISLGGVSVPIFWLALVAFYFLFFKWGVLPGSGRLDPTESPPTHLTGLYTVDALLHGQWALFWSALRHLILPGGVLAVATIGLFTRFTRASALEILGLDYVRAARLKGLPEWTVVRRHVLRPALVSIITVAGVAFASLLSGTVLVENIFSWPGVGEYAYQSAVNLDLPAIMGVSLFVAVVYIVLNLVVDLLYGVIDPRIRLA